MEEGQENALRTSRAPVAFRCLLEIISVKEEHDLAT
jgi:hypothetical protein